MPVRIERDQPGPGNSDRRNPRKPESGIPLGWILIGLFAILRKPKWIIPILLVAGLFYWLNGGFNLQGGAQHFPYEAAGDEVFSFGAALDVEAYDQALVYEGLAVGSSALPSSVDLRAFAPDVLHQGSQGSCSGWASAYSARTVSYAKATGQRPDQVAFSPSFLYNQIALPRCEGALLKDAMEAMVQIGSLPFREFGYTDASCQLMPDLSHQQAAAEYRIQGYNRLTRGPLDYRVETNAVKEHLAQGAPVVIGMMVGQSFQAPMQGRAIWKPTQLDYAGIGQGGHAMSVVGYDDKIAGGSFLLMNSWGKAWGDNGYAWVTYNDFNQFVKEAYGLFPDPSRQESVSPRLEVRLALVEQQQQRMIPIEQIDEIAFSTKETLPKGTRFKLAISNAVPCYTYVFGFEQDGSSYVLFPYTDKHSPYCGITGTRVFPKEHSMVLDQIGNQDYLGVMVSKKPLDFNAINQRINASREQSPMLKLASGIIDDFVPSCDFEVDESIYFNCETADRNALALLIKLDKK